MNFVIYAGDRKYHSILSPISNQLKSTKHNFLYVYNKQTHILYPTHPDHKQYYHYDGQTNIDEHHESHTLGFVIPFKPDVLLIARERWQPEQSIIEEFKTKWDCTVCCVEVSSHLSNNIENRLEMMSRTRYPQNKIDYFFEHSNWAKERRIDCLDESYREKIIVVGNTRSFEPDREKNIRDKYNIDSNKKQILFWGVINTTRNTAFDALKVLAEKTKETHQIFYKCYPGEPYNEKFSNQFNPFIIDGVQVVYDEDDVYDIANVCETHIGQASSVFNFAFCLNKKIVNLDSVCGASEKMNDINVFINETGNGVEDSAKFWMNVWGLKNIEEFKNLVDIERINLFKRTNFEFMESVKKNTLDFDWECNFLDTDKKDYGDLIRYFDEYEFDGMSSKRIIDFLEKKL